MSKRRWPVVASSASSRRGEEVDEQRGQAGLAAAPAPPSRLRGLWRLLPEPCAKRTRPRARAGRARSPTRSPAREAHLLLATTSAAVISSAGYVSGSGGRAGGVRLRRRQQLPAPRRRVVCAKSS